MKKMLFLENPPAGAVPVLGKPRRKGAAKHRRPGTALREGVMPKKRRRSAKRPNPPRRFVRAKSKRVRRYRRRNPAGFSVNALMKATMQGAMDGVYGVAGKVATRVVASKIGMGEGIVGSLIQAGIGVVGGQLMAKFMGADSGRAFTQGAMMAAIEPVIANANIPVISGQLSGYNNFILPTAYNAGILSPGPAVGMQGYPSLPPAFAGYPQSPAFGDFNTNADGYGW